MSPMGIKANTIFTDHVKSATVNHENKSITVTLLDFPLETIVVEPNLDSIDPSSTSDFKARIQHICNGVESDDCGVFQIVKSHKDSMMTYLRNVSLASFILSDESRPGALTSFSRISFFKDLDDDHDPSTKL